MWLRSLGAMSLAVLFTNGLAFGQGAIAGTEGGSNASFGWLSPSSLMWAPPLEFNWADLPIRIHATENAGYNSNILNLYPGQKLPNGLTRGDRFVRTDLGVSTKTTIEAQQIFADLDYITTDYLHDKELDLHNHYFDGGVNWTLGAHCYGTLKALSSALETPQEQQITFGQDISTIKSITEDSQCHLYQDVNILTNAGASTTRHSQVISRQLDYDNAFAQGGLQYAWNGLDSIEALVRYSYTHYVNQVPVVSQFAIPPVVRLLNYQILYNNTMSPKINYSLMGGFSQDVGVSQSSTNSGGPGPAQPIYAVTLNYQPSEKLGFTAAVSRYVSPPTSVFANTQINTAESLSLHYSLSPKVLLTASVGLSTTSGSSHGVPGTFGANTLLSTSLKASYELTRFTSLTASMQNSSRETNGQRVRTEIIMIGLDFRPY